MGPLHVDPVVSGGLRMNERWPSLRIMLQAVFGWSAGAVFAVVWLWLFFGIQLTTRQAWSVVILFAALGLVFGAVQAWRRARTSVSNFDS